MAKQSAIEQDGVIVEALSNYSPLHRIRNGKSHRAQTPEFLPNSGSKCFLPQMV